MPTTTTPVPYRPGRRARSHGACGTHLSQVRVLPELRGKDIVELGCETGYFGARLKMAEAERVVGIDVTPAQNGHSAPTRRTILTRNRNS